MISCGVTGLGYGLVLECFPLRVGASPFQEEKENLKGEVWKGCLIQVGRIRSYD